MSRHHNDVEELWGPTGAVTSDFVETPEGYWVDYELAKRLLYEWSDGMANIERLTVDPFSSFETWWEGGAVTSEAPNFLEAYWDVVEAMGLRDGLPFITHPPVCIVGW